jgi:hypothetical protein
MTDFSQYKPPSVDPCRYGHNTFLFCPPERCLCKREADVRDPTRKTVASIVEEGRQLFAAATKDWEFHDYSKPFQDFASWCEDNFDLVIGIAGRAAPPRTCEEAGDRCKHMCTVNMATGEIKDPDCFR